MSTARQSVPAGTAWVGRVILFRLSSAQRDLAHMRATRKQVASTLAQAPRPHRVVFDLRACTFGLAEVWFTVRTLVRAEDHIAATFARSAALLADGGPAVRALVRVFEHVYTPVRPFAIFFDDEDAAVAFCAQEADA